MRKETIGFASALLIGILFNSSCSPNTNSPNSSTGKNEPAAYSGVWVGGSSQGKMHFETIYIADNKFPCDGTIVMTDATDIQIPGSKVDPITMKASVVWEERDGQLVGVVEKTEKNGTITKLVIAKARLSDGTLSGEVTPVVEDGNLRSETFSFSQFRKQIKQ